MSKEKHKKKTSANLNELPEDKITEVDDFMDSLFENFNEEIQRTGTQKMAFEFDPVYFLYEEEDPYLENDLKER